jgi:hypothetical protein
MRLYRTTKPLKGLRTGRWIPAIIANKVNIQRSALPLLSFIFTDMGHREG